MYTLNDTDRQMLEDWFATPFSAAELTSRDGLGARFTLVREEDDRWLLRSAHRAMVWVDVSDGDAVGYTLMEGDDAREMDRRYSFQMRPDTRDRLVKTLLPGTDAEAGLDAVFGDDRDGVESISHARLPDGARGTYYVEDEGVFVLDVDDDGAVTELRIVSGPDAYDLYMAG